MTVVEPGSASGTAEQGLCSESRLRVLQPPQLPHSDLPSRGAATARQQMEEPPLLEVQSLGNLQPHVLGRDWPHNLQGPVQNANAEPLVQKGRKNVSVFCGPFFPQSWCFYLFHIMFSEVQDTRGVMQTLASTWGGRAVARGAHTSRGSGPLAHVTLSHWTSLTKHKFKDKIMKNIKIMTREH